MRWEKGEERSHKVTLEALVDREEAWVLVLCQESLGRFGGTRPSVFQAPAQHNDKTPRDNKYYIPSPKRNKQALGKVRPLSRLHNWL